MRSFLRTGVLTLTALAALSPAAIGATITTNYNSNNNGSAGGGIYFNLTVGSTGVSITGFDINTSVISAFTLSVYTVPTTAFGNETNGGAWTLVATGNGTGAGTNNPSTVTLSSAFSLDPNATYGLALVLTGAEHRYTGLGAGGSPTATFSNSDLTILTGTATNVPFTGGVFTPRVFNGAIHYDLIEDPPPPSGVPEPTSAVLSVIGLGAIAVGLRRKRA